MRFKIPLSDIAEIVMGQSPVKSDVNRTVNGIALLNGPTEFGNRYPSAVQHTTNGKRFSESEDILFCVRGSTTGKMNYADTKYAIGRGLAAIRGKNGIPTPVVKALIENSLPSLLQAATGSTFPNVSKELLHSFQVEKLTVQEAYELNKLITSIEDKVFNNTQMNQTLEKIAQRIFKSWFINFDPVKANAEGLPFAGLSPDIQSLFPSEFIESEMGLIPKGWEVKNLESFVEYVSKGTTPTKSDLSSAKDGNKIHYLKVRDIDNSGLISSNLDRIPESIHKSKLKRSILKRNDLIVSIAGTIGRVTVIPDRLNNSNCNQAVCFIRLPEESIYHNYVRLILTQKRTKEYFESSVVQGVQANISLAVIKNTSILDPKEQIIECWNNTISSIIERISVNNEQNIKLQNIRDRLLPKLLSGSIKINQKLDEAS
jgi:type I restriction enzyme S subunit